MKMGFWDLKKGQNDKKGPIHENRGLSSNNIPRYYSCIYIFLRSIFSEIAKNDILRDFEFTQFHEHSKTLIFRNFKNDKKFKNDKNDKK